MERDVRVRTKKKRPAGKKGRGLRELKIRGTKGAPTKVNFKRAAKTAKKK